MSILFRRCRTARPRQWWPFFINSCNGVIKILTCESPPKCCVLLIKNLLEEPWICRYRLYLSSRTPTYTLDCKNKHTMHRKTQEIGLKSNCVPHSCPDRRTVILGHIQQLQREQRHLDENISQSVRMFLVNIPLTPYVLTSQVLAFVCSSLSSRLQSSVMQWHL